MVSYVFYKSLKLKRCLVKNKTLDCKNIKNMNLKINGRKIKDYKVTSKIKNSKLKIKQSLSEY